MFFSKKTSFLIFWSFFLKPYFPSKKTLGIQRRSDLGATPPFTTPNVHRRRNGKRCIMSLQSHGRIFFWSFFFGGGGWLYGWGCGWVRLGWLVGCGWLVMVVDDAVFFGGEVVHVFGVKSGWIDWDMMIQTWNPKQPFIYKWMFQLDDEPNLYIENGWKSPNIHL